jgi:hypothetical protein
VVHATICRYSTADAAPGFVPGRCSTWATGGLVWVYIVETPKQLEAGERLLVQDQAALAEIAR